MSEILYRGKCRDVIICANMGFEYAAMRGVSDLASPIETRSALYGHPYNSAQSDVFLRTGCTAVLVSEMTLKVT